MVCSAVAGILVLKEFVVFLEMAWDLVRLQLFVIGRLRSYLLVLEFRSVKSDANVTVEADVEDCHVEDVKVDS